jgi:hypothetical protein
MIGEFEYDYFSYRLFKPLFDTVIICPQNTGIIAFLAMSRVFSEMFASHP